MNPNFQFRKTLFRECTNAHFTYVCIISSGPFQYINTSLFLFLSLSTFNKISIMVNKVLGVWYELWKGFLVNIALDLFSVLFFLHVRYNIFYKNLFINGKIIELEYILLRGKKLLKLSKGNILWLLKGKFQLNRTSYSSIAMDTALQKKICNSYEHKSFMSYQKKKIVWEYSFRLQ